MGEPFSILLQTTKREYKLCTFGRKQSNSVVNITILSHSKDIN